MKNFKKYIIENNSIEYEDEENDNYSDWELTHPIPEFPNYQSSSFKSYGFHDNLFNRYEKLLNKSDENKISKKAKEKYLNGNNEIEDAETAISTIQDDILNSKKSSLSFSYAEDLYDDAITDWNSAVIQIYYKIAIKYIFNKFNSLQIKKINQDPELIEIIDNPSEEIQKLALSKNPLLFLKYPKKFNLKIKEKYKHLKIIGKTGMFEDK